MSLVHLHLMLNHAPVIGVVFAALLLSIAVLRHSDELTKVAFGFLVLGSTDLLVATAAGLAGAVIAEALTRRRMTRAPASNACEAPSGHRVRSPGG